MTQRWPGLCKNAMHLIPVRHGYNPVLSWDRVYTCLSNYTNTHSSRTKGGHDWTAACQLVFFFKPNPIARQHRSELKYWWWTKVHCNIKSSAGRIAHWCVIFYLFVSQVCSDFWEVHLFIPLLDFNTTSRHGSDHWQHKGRNMEWETSGEKNNTNEFPNIAEEVYFDQSAWHLEGFESKSYIIPLIISSRWHQYMH